MQLPLSYGPPALTVSSFTEQLTGLLLDNFSDVWIAGECSGVKQAPSGHWYFTLKDDGAQLRCACFKQNAMRLRVKPTEGMAILARGRIEVYAARGDYQLIVEAIEPQGLGALQAAFELLKKKLKAEGLFEAARKRPLPEHPARVGIVTSSSGAAIQDMLNVLARRAPGLHIRLYPAQVQGEFAVEQIVRGVEYFSKSGWADVVIVGRGGGSIEDLWAFNEEAVARAIAASSVPVVSAVGHETDFTIADFVADLRAPTPSAAAELVTQYAVQRPKRLESVESHLVRAMQLRLSRASDRLGRQGIARAQLLVRLRLNRLAQRFDDLDSRLRRGDLRLKLREAKERELRLAARLEHAMRLRLNRARPRVERVESSLRQLGPLAVLDRGYAIVLADGKAVKEPPAAESELDVRVAGGRFRAVTY